MPITLSVAQQFSRTPGPRARAEGAFSGEQFREDLLFPTVAKAKAEGRKLLVDLDGTAGYGTSFLEEAFGGLVRHNSLTANELLELLEVKSNEEDYLIADVKQYIREAKKP